MPDIEKELALEESLLPQPSASPGAQLAKAGNDLINQIIEEQDVDKVNDLTQLFNLNQRKREIARTNRLSNLLEIIDDEVITRFSAYPESFDNDQLVKYMDATQRTINNISQNINQTPQIQINTQHNEVHINQSGLDRESRAKVLSTVNAILSSLQNTQEDDIIDIEIGGNK